MNRNDLAGFHFLPPSVHLPPSLRPVHSATAATMVEPASATGAVLLPAVAADHVFPLAFSQT